LARRRRYYDAAAMGDGVLILNLAYLVLVASTFTRTVLSLRVALLLGAFGFVIYGLVASVYTVAVWNSVTGTLHSIQLYRYVSARRAVELTADDEFWHSELFASLDRFDFYSLWSMGEESHRSDARLVTAGEQHDRVAIVLEGDVEIRNGSQHVASLSRGSLIGEMSYIRGVPANSDVFAVGDVRLRVWDQQRLRALDQLNPPAGRAFSELIQRDLATKLS
jgi:hypothetical protein